jgi:hypothetical protein
VLALVLGLVSFVLLIRWKPNGRPS